MRITLIHNPTAGDEKHSRRKLVQAIESAGHQVRYRSSKTDFKPAFRLPADLVVVAGGDGTVSKVARAIIGRSLPVSVLPLGTANNIAASLGIEARIQTLAQGWSGASRISVQLGTLVGLARKRYFLEAVGLGMIPALMAAASKDDDHHESARTNIRRNLRRLRDLTRRAKPRRWNLEVDDHDLSGEYLLFEVMNIRAIGPTLVLAPQADPTDLVFDVVMVTASERDQVLELIENHLQGGDPVRPLPVRQATRVRIHSPVDDFHVDDKLLSSKLRRGTIELSLRGDSVEFLVPS